MLQFNLEIYSGVNPDNHFHLVILKVELIEYLKCYGSKNNV